MTDQAGPLTTEARPINSIAVLGARITWLFFGPMVAAILLAAIVVRGTGWLTTLDLAFAVVLALMLIGRWVEQRSGAATTYTGEPATRGDFRAYMTWAPLAGAALWTTANIFGNHLL